GRSRGRGIPPIRCARRGRSRRARRVSGRGRRRRRRPGRGRAPRRHVGPWRRRVRGRPGPGPRGRSVRGARPYRPVWGGGTGRRDRWARGPVSSTVRLAPRAAGGWAVRPSLSATAPRSDRMTLLANTPNLTSACRNPRTPALVTPGANRAGPPSVSGPPARLGGLRWTTANLTTTWENPRVHPRQGPSHRRRTCPEEAAVRGSAGQPLGAQLRRAERHGTA